MATSDENYWNHFLVGTIDPSLLCLPEDEPFANLDDETFNSLLRDFDPNATPIASPKLISEPQDEPLPASEPLLLTPESVSYLAKETSNRSTPSQQSAEDVSPGRTATEPGVSKRGKKRVRSTAPKSEEDNSEASWTEADSGLERYSVAIENRLKDLPFHSLLLPSLSNRERRVLRAQAHMKRLNHVSFGRGKSRCLLLSEYVIIAGKRRPRTGSYFIGGEYDPVCELTNISPLVFRDPLSQEKYFITKSWSYEGIIDATDFRRILQVNGLPSPVSQSHPPATFKSPNEVGEICAAPHRRTIGSEGVTQSYDKVLVSFFPPSRAGFSKMTSPAINNSEDSADETRPQLHLGPPVADPDSEVSDSGSLFAPPASSSASVASDVDQPGRKRQKRMPRNEGGYPCRYTDCMKKFDRAGERRKHEASHEPDSRRHGCQECGRRFMYPKDLRRHFEMHGHPRSLSVKSSSSERHAESATFSQAQQSYLGEPCVQEVRPERAFEGPSPAFSQISPSDDSQEEAS